MSRFFFFVQEASRALRRNAAPTTAAIVTTVTTVVLLGVLIPVFQTVQGKSDEVRSSLEFRVPVYDDATHSEVAALQHKLEAIPHVATVREISKKEALNELKSQLDEKESKNVLAALNGNNPLPRNFAVKTDDASHLAAARRAVAPIGPDGKPHPISSIIPVEEPTFDRQQDAEEIVQVTSAVKIILTVITALLVLASLMLVSNTIRLSIYTRRREVEVMRLVGATRWFIRWPFMIEGAVVGFVGGVLAILVLWIGKVAVVDPLSSKIGLFEAQKASTLAFPALIGILFAAAMLVSAIGSGVTLRRFLKV